MECPICNAEIPANCEYCPSCGRRISVNENSYTHLAEDNTIKHNCSNENMTSQSIPSQYEPISSWGYVGYTILFSIPFIGFILLIVFALSNDNINRRNFARSYFCTILLVVIAFIVFGAAIAEVLAELFSTI